jgi:membrane protein DedA with SNARE-associated domain
MFSAPLPAIECTSTHSPEVARKVAVLNFPIEHGSYGIIFLVLVLTGAGLPMPEEVPIIYAGVAASAGTLNPWAALAVCFAGALMGDCVLYSIGYHFGHSLAMKHPRLADFLHADREARVERMIRKHGLKVLFVARFLVFFRAPVYLAAGVLRMPARQFVLIDSFCAAAVVGAVFGLSYYYGDQIQRFIRGSELLLTIIVALCVLAVALWTWWKSRRGHTGETPGDNDHAETNHPEEVTH